MLGIIIQILFTIFLLAFLIFFVIQFYNIVFRGYAPFIATRRKILKKILDELEIKDDAIIYELGCGRAGFLRALRKKYPKAKLVGFEYSFLPYFVAKIQKGFTGCRINIKKKNILKVGLGEADMIYCYLNRKTMRELENKFKKECKQGAQIVSYQFPLPNTEPAKVVEIDSSAHKVYFYKL